MRKLDNLTIGTGHNAITLTASEVRELLRRLVIEVDYTEARRLLAEAREHVYGSAR